MSKIDVNAYTSMIHSDVFQQLIIEVSAELQDYVSQFDSEKTLVSAARAHDRRSGGEFVLAALITKPTTDSVLAAQQQELPEPDFNSAAILNSELFPQA